MVDPPHGTLRASVELAGDGGRSSCPLWGSTCGDC